MSPAICQQSRTRPAELVSAVSLAEATVPWGFFAGGAFSWFEPRWNLPEGKDASIVADRTSIRLLFTERLGEAARRRA
jgi:hypothetical protein